MLAMVSRWTPKFSLMAYAWLYTPSIMMWLFSTRPRSSSMHCRRNAEFAVRAMKMIAKVACSYIYSFPIAWYLTYSLNPRGQVLKGRAQESRGWWGPNRLGIGSSLFVWTQGRKAYSMAVGKTRLVSSEERGGSGLGRTWGRCISCGDGAFVNWCS
jgi:hypothetical protein